ncbi:MAG: hypothetical protein NVSMB9_08180 [Isosphaeraceae bacterium]
MNHRPTLLAAAVLAAIVLSEAPTSGRADAIGSPTYVLTTDHAIPAPDASANGPQVIASIQPPNTVTPIKQSDGTTGSPLTILSSSFHAADDKTYANTGYDQNNLIVALKEDGSGGTSQLFGLSFFGQGLDKNGQLLFNLNVTDPSHAPQLLSQTSGVSISQLLPFVPPPAPPVVPPTPPPSNPTPPPTDVLPGTTNIPEPMSLIRWSAQTGAGLLRARSLRRRRRAAG